MTFLSLTEFIELLIGTSENDTQTFIVFFVATVLACYFLVLLLDIFGLVGNLMRGNHKF